MLDLWIKGLSLGSGNWGSCELIGFEVRAGLLGVESVVLGLISPPVCVCKIDAPDRLADGLERWYDLANESVSRDCTCTLDQSREKMLEMDTRISLSTAMTSHSAKDSLEPFAPSLCTRVLRHPPCPPRLCPRDRLSPGPVRKFRSCIAAVFNVSARLLSARSSCP